MQSQIYRAYLECVSEYLHATQKSVSNLIPLIEAFSKLGSIVLDPFCGSGSTLAAAGLSGRRFVGIELSNDDCETARRRTEQVRLPVLSAAAG